LYERASITKKEKKIVKISNLLKHFFFLPTKLLDGSVTKLFFITDAAVTQGRVFVPGYLFKVV
jgi:hypothetical protein